MYNFQQINPYIFNPYSFYGPRNSEAWKDGLNFFSKEDNLKETNSGQPLDSSSKSFDSKEVLQSKETSFKSLPQKKIVAKKAGQIQSKSLESPSDYSDSEFFISSKKASTTIKPVSAIKKLVPVPKVVSSSKTIFSKSSPSRSVENQLSSEPNSSSYSSKLSSENLKKHSTSKTPSVSKKSCSTSSSSSTSSSTSSSSALSRIQLPTPSHKNVVRTPRFRNSPKKFSPSTVVKPASVTRNVVLKPRPKLRLAPRIELKPRVELETTPKKKNLIVSPVYSPPRLYSKFPSQLTSCLRDSTPLRQRSRTSESSRSSVPLLLPDLPQFKNQRRN